MSVQLIEQTVLTERGFEKILVERPTMSLGPLGRGARLHSESQVKRIMASIERFGFRVPILIDAKCRIIAGEGSWRAAQMLRLTTVPTLMVTDLGEPEVRLLRLAIIQTGHESKWDNELLSLELGDIHVEAPTLDLTVSGFSQPEIEALRFGRNEPQDRGDALPVDLSLTVSRLGDLWICGHHRVLAGNALEAQDYAALMAGDLARSAFLDAPYNCAVQGHVTSNPRHSEFVMASGEMSEPEFLTFLTTNLACVREHCVAGAVIFACIDWRNVELLIRAGRAAGLELLNLAVWVKQPGMGSYLRSAHEMIVIFKKPGAPHVNNVQLGANGRNRSNVWTYDGVNGFGAAKAKLRALHPTCKPVRLVENALLDVTSARDVVIDTFSGSGTTLIACEKIERVARVMDLDPRYVDVTVRRWQEFSGREAVLAETGQTFREVAHARTTPQPAAVEPTLPRVRTRRRAANA